MKNDTAKTLGATVLTVLGAALDIIAVPFTVLCLLMATDYCTGLVKSKRLGTVNSRTGLKGIIKKLCYAGAVMAAAGVDYTISALSGAFGEDFNYRAIFVLLVTFWLIINECISILENLSAIAVPFPPFMKKVLKAIKGDIESKGDKA